MDLSSFRSTSTKLPLRRTAVLVSAFAMVCVAVVQMGSVAVDPTIVLPPTARSATASASPLKIRAGQTGISVRTAPVARSTVTAATTASIVAMAVS